jgi:DNA-binding NarL/FixJ family response regulator
MEEDPGGSPEQNPGQPLTPPERLAHLIASQRSRERTADVRAIIYSGLGTGSVDKAEAVVRSIHGRLYEWSFEDAMDLAESDMPKLVSMVTSEAAKPLLTYSEAQVLELFSYGLDNYQVTAELPIKYPTVLDRKASIKAKLGAENSLQTISFGFKGGVLKPRKPTPELLKAAASLTEKETQIIVMMWQGMSNQRIAAAQKTPVRTAERHIKFIKQKMGAESRAHLLRLSVEAEVIHIDM